ncbi:rubrerythrin [Anaerosolibacter carboniphilus]|uniref:Rubrerythrin n=1 Tax=Anaerosolibacter carboniphilus TaxID=1417629 RepID=A0A841L905_9FIRM|nr:rubrerythrin [Anaerosolibacter carboniphilus]
MAVEGLNELDVLKIAIGAEEEGHRFYIEAAGQYDDPQIKEMFLHLAEEEMDHIKTFQDIYKRVSSEEGRSVYEEPISAYLRALSETAVFNTNGLTNHRVRNVSSVKEALLIGIQAEKDSILFYETVQNHTKHERTKKVLSRLIKEEIKHLHKLRMLIQE